MGAKGAVIRPRFSYLDALGIVSVAEITKAYGIGAGAAALVVGTIVVDRIERRWSR